METTPFPSSFSPPPKKSRVRVSSFTLIHLLVFLFCIPNTTSFLPDLHSLSSPQISYSEHCNSIVTESISSDLTLSPSEFLQLQNGYYLGGDKFLSQDLKSSPNSPKSLVFHTQNLYKTSTEGVLKVEVTLIFLEPRRYTSLGNTTYGGGALRHGGFRIHKPRISLRTNGLTFRLQGFYSESSGKLCMVGSSSAYSKEGKSLDLSAVFKLNYPNKSTILTSFVSGTLESLDNVDSENYIEPISMLAFSQRNYNYTLISGELDNGFSGAGNGQETQSLSLDSVRGICSTLRSANGFELEYGNDCDDAKNCNPLGRSIGFLPNSMSFSGIQCSDKRRLRLLVGFSDGSYFGYNQPLVPSTTLVGEGVWDGEKNRLCVIACRILNFTDSLANASVGDCSIRLSLRFPAVMSIRNRSSVVGQIWSNRTTNDSGYFDRVLFQSSENRIWGVQGLRYEYTETGSLMKSCPKNISIRNKGKTYPDGYSNDMRFDMSVKDNKGKQAWGYSVPLSVGDQFYEHSFNLRAGFLSSLSTEVHANHSHSRLLNVSYRINFTPPPDFSLVGKLYSTNVSLSRSKPFEIAAEGIYDTKTGGLCMVGCRYQWLNHQKSTKSDSMDCDILINVQFPPLNAKSGEIVKGSIESARGNSDSLYFERLELASTAIYTKQAEKSIWRMDLEITMVLISKTLTCVFVGLQLFYVKKHPDVVPSISLLMLVILTLGHMIPLVLNFEALFSATRQSVLIGSGGWVEVNEVIVRVVTMVAFLLQFRLLQLTWSTRLGDENQKGLWNAEKNALSVSLPLYIIGGLIALMIRWLNNYYEAPRFRGKFFVHYQRHSLLGDLRSYAGLVLDSFLFPQIMLNIFWNSKDIALSPAFYVGTSAVRLLPHAYDLYRTHSYVPTFGIVSIYANPGADFFSTSWDVIITCVGLLFATLIYLQQRFGGRCILPQRFRELPAYEKVPIDSGEGL